MGPLSEYRTQLEAAFARFDAPLTTEVDQPGCVRPRRRLGVVGLRLLCSSVSRASLPYAFFQGMTRTLNSSCGAVTMLSVSRAFCHI